MGKRVAVVLAGCGVYDGSEIYESTLTFLYLNQNGAEYKCFAPDKPQMHVIDHSIGETDKADNRSVYKEAARLARGEIQPLVKLKPGDFDAVIFPGGFGVAKNLCTFAVDGPACSIEKDVERVIKETIEQKKALGAICIAPAVVARALKNTSLNPMLTVGTDSGTIDALKAMNANPLPARVDEITVDDRYKLVSTPAYMMGTNIGEVAVGIEKLVKKVLELA